MMEHSNIDMLGPGIVIHVLVISTKHATRSYFLQITNNAIPFMYNAYVYIQ